MLLISRGEYKPLSSYMTTNSFVLVHQFQRRYRRRTLEYIFCTWKYSANESTQRQDHRNAERCGICQVIGLFLA